MDPTDLLFLHSALAATIRAQQARIEELENTLAVLNESKEEQNG